MGYTHLWAIIGCTSEEWQAAWPQLIRDVPRILEAAKVPVCYSWKDGGKAKDFTDPCLANTSDGIHFNGIDEDGCEPFILEEFEDEYNFCKTSQRPYDLPVATILLRAYTLAPSCFYLRSDGSWADDWKEARALYGELWPESRELQPESWALLSKNCPWVEEEYESEDEAKEDDDGGSEEQNDEAEIVKKVSS